jgi:hypothetical protein
MGGNDLLDLVDLADKLGLLSRMTQKQYDSLTSLSVIFRWVPTKYVARPIGNTYTTLIGNPIMRFTNTRARLSIGWLILLGLWLASIFGIKLGQGNSYADRVRSLAGVMIFQLGFWSVYLSFPLHPIHCFEEKMSHIDEAVFL